MYKTSTLIEQTRLVAADYRNATGHALPVTAELARFDAIDKLKLEKMESEEGVDAFSVCVNKDLDDKKAEVKDKFLIKGRVIFKSGKARQKLGKLSFEGDWNYLLMVIYDADYSPVSIYKVDRKIIEEELVKIPDDKRGSMTVAKYKAIGEQVWAAES